LNQSHVKRLAESIKARNLLELRPISVNAEMEVIDGQHRLMAAKLLGEEIFYIQDSGLTCADIILMNVSKAWGQNDYLNYYCKNGYQEYIKLTEFTKKNGINIKVALNITMGTSKDGYNKFKNGEYQFTEDNFEEDFAICWDTIDYIKKINGYSYYTCSARFWSALLVLIRHADFDKIRWRENLKKMIERFTAKAKQEDYLRLFMDVHNWRNKNKLDLINPEF
jgi:hypothetical protein